MERIKKISVQSLWQVLNKIIISSTMIVVLGLVARNYGANGTGIFTLSLTLLNMLYLGVDLGINAHALPESLKEDFPATWQKLLGLRIILALILVIVSGLVVLVLPLDPIFRWAVLFGLLSIIGVAVFYNSNLLFQSRLRFDLFAYSSISGSLVGLLIVFLLVKSHLGVQYLLLAGTVGYFGSALLSLIFVRHYIKIFPKFELNSSFLIFKKIWPLSLTVFSNVIYFRIDAFILSAVKSFAEVGIYNLAYQIFQSLLVIPAYIMNSFYPLMIKDFAEDRKKFKTNLIKACLGMFTVAVIGMFFTIILAPFAVSIIAGAKDFSGSVTALRILSLGFPAFFVTSVLMWTLIVLKKYKIMMGIYFFGLIFNALANLFVIPVYSYVGASVVTGVSEYLILLLQLVILIPVLKNEKN